MKNSWGKLETFTNNIQNPFWTNEVNLKNTQSTLAHGNLRSYGDSCYVKSGNNICTLKLNRFINFDNGILECESGVLISDIIKYFLPLGWFPEIVPGTKFVTVGGAIANDIHSKNHHISGSYGNNTISFELLRSDGKLMNCSDKINSEMFKATIGGLGLTGFIKSAKIKLKKVKNSYIDTETIKFSDLNEYFNIEKNSSNYNYTVAWIDCYKNGRGHYIRGKHNNISNELSIKNPQFLALPFNLPNFTMNKLSMKLLNELYFNRKLRRTTYNTQHYNSFFFPLDGIINWNRAYGKNGFFQHQSVIPKGNEVDTMKEIIKLIKKSECHTFLSVLKRFGDIKPRGLLSFPMEGITFAVDFANEGEKTIRLMKNLEKVVLKSKGRIYPAKDNLMDASTFKSSYPNFTEFYKYKDVNFESSFWKRVANE